MSTDQATTARRSRANAWAHRALMDPSSETSLAHRFRAKRWDLLLERFPDLGDMRILDVGGKAERWLEAPIMPAQVVSMNLEPQVDTDHARITNAFGDACDPPDWLAGERFDLVHSNSVIEHVGGHDRCQRFAETILAVAPRHWVQTPWRYFPIEPHFLFPFAQQLPTSARALIVRKWPLGMFKRPFEQENPVGSALSVDLLSRTDLAHYFPDSEILVERVLSIPKSLIAVSPALRP